MFLYLFQKSLLWQEVVFNEATRGGLAEPPQFPPCLIESFVAHCAPLPEGKERQKHERLDQKPLEVKLTPGGYIQTCKKYPFSERLGFGFCHQNFVEPKKAAGKPRGLFCLV